MFVYVEFKTSEGLKMYLHDKYWWQSETGNCNTYGNWIETNYPDKASCVNKCNEAVSRMIDYFRELRVQVGRANGIYHCWCKASDGSIVDPTAKQFGGTINYTLIADRFLRKDEIELSTGAIFLDK